MARRTFSQHAGGVLRRLTNVGLAVAAVGYAGMSCSYGPYEALEVAYSEVTGNKGIKHREVEEAKWLYAGKMHKTQLDSNDMKGFWSEMHVVPADGRMPNDEDISWKRLLDWIEDN